MNTTTSNMEKLRTKILTGKIKHVLLDLDGTLYSSKSGIEFQIPPLMVKHAAVVLSIEEVEAKKLLREYREKFKSSVIGLEKFHGVNPTEFYKMVYDDIDISSIEKYDGLHEQMRTLSGMIKLHLLTNSNSTHAKRVLKKLQIEQYFENIFSVENANFIRKPNPFAYEIAIEKMKALPSEIINIDDSYLNLKVANELGLYTIIVSNGIAEPPLFWEMHEKVFHEAPNYVDGSFHSINNAIYALCNDHP